MSQFVQSRFLVISRTLVCVFALILVLVAHSLYVNKALSSETKNSNQLYKVNQLPIRQKVLGATSGVLKEVTIKTDSLKKPQIVSKAETLPTEQKPHQQTYFTQTNNNFPFGNIPPHLSFGYFGAKQYSVRDYRSLVVMGFMTDRPDGGYQPEDKIHWYLRNGGTDTFLGKGLMISIPIADCYSGPTYHVVIKGTDSGGLQGEASQVINISHEDCQKGW